MAQNQIQVSEKRIRTRKLALIIGPLISLCMLLFLDLDPEHPGVTRTAAVALLMAIWWITEAIPLAATALLPVVLFPFLGIMKGKTVAPLYFNYIIFLFICGLSMSYYCNRRCTQIHADLVGARLGAPLPHSLHNFLWRSLFFKTGAVKLYSFPNKAVEVKQPLRALASAFSN